MRSNAFTNVRTSATGDVNDDSRTRDAGLAGVVNDLASAAIVATDVIPDHFASTSVFPRR